MLQGFGKLGLVEVAWHHHVSQASFISLSERLASPFSVFGLVPLHMSLEQYGSKLKDR